MRHASIFILIICIAAPVIKGQDVSDTISPSEKLYFGFHNINFLKNDEYSNPVIEGYTLIGYFLQPEFIYRPASAVTLKLGAHLLSYSGTNRFSQVKPVFSTSFNFSKRSYITLGSLSASYREGLFDPNFNKERLYTSFSDEGIQVRLLNNNLLSDTWVNWENFIFKGDSDREIFTAGESFKYSSRLIGQRLRIYIPLQILFKHFGGQISNYAGEVETYMNAAGGITLELQRPDQKPGNAGIRFLGFMGRCLTKNAPSGINKGYGLWSSLFYSFKGAEIRVGYWKSHDFYSPEGNFIFSSVSDHLENVIIHNRDIITGSAGITIFREGFLKIRFAVDGYYDIDLKRLDNAVTLHLKFDRLFSIATLKPE
jgi:hypothetical protein